MTQDEIKFYTYAHFKKDNSTIFYIGKGKKGREVVRQGRNKHWINTVNKHGLSVERLAIWKTEKEAFEHEKFLIWCFKDMGYNLVNMTDGGEGLSNPSNETREKMSVSQFARNRKLTEEHKTALSIAHKGKPLSVEHRKKIALANSGKKKSSESIAKMSANAWAKTEEGRKSLSLSTANYWKRKKGLL
jgi:hypothetical protein